MATKPSVRLILVAGYGVAAAVLVVLGFVVFGDDRAEPPPSPEATPRETREPRRSVDRSAYVPDPSLAPEAPIRPAPKPLELDGEPVEELGPIKVDGEPADVPGGWRALAEAHQQMVTGAPSDLDELSRMERAQELTAAAIVPEYDAEGFVGLRVRGEPDPESTLGLLGVTRGMLITSVNGMGAGEEGVAPESLMQELAAQRDVALTFGR